jgi:hypothetical protein
MGNGPVVMGFPWTPRGMEGRGGGPPATSFEGLKSPGQPSGQGAAFVGRGVTEGAKSLLLKVAQGVVSTLDAKPDGYQR